MLDRTVAPPFVKTTSFDLITPEETQLPNGLKVFFIPGGSQEVLKIEFIFEAGRWFEKKTGAAYFTGQLLPKGTHSKASFEIAQIFDRYGAHLEISPGQDFVSVALYALNKNLSPVVRLLAELLTTPAFPEKEFDQARAIYLQNLKINLEKTSFVASQVFRKKLFGKGHPYGGELEEKNAKALHTQDFVEHFRKYFHMARVFVSGRIDPASRDLMLGTFAELPSGGNVASPVHTTVENRQYDYIEKEESVQSSVRAGRHAVLRSHPDYVPLLFASHILGGYFGSRLMKNIREEKGLTYGISASIHGLKHGSYLVIGADVNKENIEMTFGEISKELRLLRTEAIAADELETARNHFIGSLQSEITTPFAHADKIKTIELFGLQSDHYQTMIRRIDALTHRDILEVSERYLHEDSIVRVAVG